MSLVVLVAGLLAVCACGQHPSESLEDSTMASVAQTPIPEVPFEQQAQNILATKDIQWIAPFWYTNTVRLEKAGLKGTFEQAITGCAREQAVWALDGMESLSTDDPLVAESARVYWDEWQKVRKHYPSSASALTEKEEARLEYAFDVVFAHSLVTQARAIDTRTQRASIADLSGDLGALRFPRVRGGFNNYIPRPSGVTVVKTLDDEGLLPRQDLLQLLRIGVRDTSLYSADMIEVRRTRFDPNDRSLLALLQLELPGDASDDTLASYLEERVQVGALGLRALVDSFQLTDAELVALGVTAQEARFILESERIADMSANLLHIRW